MADPAPLVGFFCITIGTITPPGNLQPDHQTAAFIIVERSHLQVRPLGSRRQKTWVEQHLLVVGYRLVGYQSVRFVEHERDLQDTFGNSVISVILDTISVWYYCILPCQVVRRQREKGLLVLELLRWRRTCELVCGLRYRLALWVRMLLEAAYFTCVNQNSRL